MNTEQFFEGPGASTMQTYIWEIAFILLGAFILGYLLRLMLNSKYKAKILDLNAEIDRLNAKKPEFENTLIAAAPFDTTEYDTKIRDQRLEIDKLNLKLSEYVNAKITAESSLSSLKQEMDELKSSLKVSAAPILKVETEIAKSLDTNVVLEAVVENTETVIEDVKEVEETKDIVEATKEEVLHAVKPETELKTESFVSETPSVIDNLKKIEGIGPKIESLLNEAGIYSFRDLKEAKPDYIREVLVAAGPNYAVHDPATWSEQATLANNGNWDALSRLQEVLKGGKRK